MMTFNSGCNVQQQTNKSSSLPVRNAGCDSSWWHGQLNRRSKFISVNSLMGTIHGFKFKTVGLTPEKDQTGSLSYCDANFNWSYWQNLPVAVFEIRYFCPPVDADMFSAYGDWVVQARHELSQSGCLTCRLDNKLIACCSLVVHGCHLLHHFNVIKVNVRLLETEISIDIPIQSCWKLLFFFIPDLSVPHLFICLHLCIGTLCPPSSPRCYIFKT